MNLSSTVISELNHYVYLYVDPRDESVFCVGKGRGERCLSHLSQGGETEKAKKIAAIRDDGSEPRIDILVHGLPNAAIALQIEAAMIYLFARDELTNHVRRWKNHDLAR